MFKIKIYIDVLFVLNAVITCFILYAVSVLTKENINSARLLFASAFGGLYACLMFFPVMKIFYSFLCKIIFSFFIVFVAYKNNKFIVYIKKVCVFYLVSFVLGGVMFALICFTNIRLKNVMIANGIYYFDIPVYLILLSTLVSYFFVSFLSKVYEHNKKTNYKTVRVYLNGKCAILNCLIDTGNLLCDPATGHGVIITELDALKNIFSKDMYDFFINYSFNQKNEILENMKIRIIPFSSVGNENGFILGFKPDYVVADEKELNNVVIGVYCKKLSLKHNYNALIGYGI